MRRRFLFPVEDKTQSSDVRLPPVVEPGGHPGKRQPGRKRWEASESSIALKPLQDWSATVSLGCLLNPTYRHYDVVIGWDEDKIDTGVWSKDVRTFTRLYYARYGNGPPGKTPWRGATMEKELGTSMAWKQDGVPSDTFLTETRNIPYQKQHTPRCLWEQYSSEPLEGLTLKELFDWVIDVQPRSIHDLKPLLVLCQGLLKDTLEENMNGKNADLEKATRKWASERQELIDQYVGVIEGMKVELSEFATTSQHNESKARISNLLNRAATCTKTVLSQKQAEAQKKALFASKSEAVSLRTETINMEAKMKKLQQDLDTLKAENSELSTTNDAVIRELQSVKSRLDTMDSPDLQACVRNSFTRVMSLDDRFRDSTSNSGFDHGSEVDEADGCSGNLEGTSMDEPDKTGTTDRDIESRGCGPDTPQEKWREEKCEQYKRNILENMLKPKDEKPDLPREIRSAASKEGVIDGLNKLLQDLFEDVDGVVFIVEPDLAIPDSFTLSPRRFGRDCSRLAMSIPTQERAARRAIHARKMVGHEGYVAIPMQGRKKLASAVIVLPATTLPISLKADYGTYSFAGGKTTRMDEPSRGNRKEAPRRSGEGNRSNIINTASNSVSYGKPPAKGIDIEWHFPGMIEGAGGGYLPIPNRASFQDISIANTHIDIKSRIKETRLKGVVHSPQEAVGFVTSGNMVVSTEGCVIGRTDNAGGYLSLGGKLHEDHFVRIAKVVRDDEGIPIGYVKESGQAFDMQGSVIGREALDGRVLENNGSVVGWVNPVDAVHASEFVTAERTSSSVKADLQGLRFKGIIRNEAGEILGFVTTGNVVLNSKGTLIGTTTSDGKFCSTLPGGGSASSFVECNVVRSGVGLPVGYIGDEGEAIDCSGIQFGSGHDNGQVVDSNGHYVGWIDPGFALRLSSSLQADMSDIKFQGVLTGPNQEDLGLCASDRCILYPSGEVIGHLDEDGQAFGLLRDRLRGAQLSSGPVVQGVDKQILGHLKDDRTAVDFNGNILGEISGKSASGVLMTKDGKVLEVAEKPPEKGDGNGPSPRTTINLNIAEYSGVVQNTDGETIGLLTSEGAAISLAGEVFGWFEPGTATIVGQDNIKIKISQVVRAENGAPTGYTDDFGNVVDLDISVNKNNDRVETRPGNQISPRKWGGNLPNGEQGVRDWLPGAAGLFVDYSGQVQGLCGADGVAKTFEGSFAGQVQRDCAITNENRESVGWFMELAPEVKDDGSVTGCMLPDGTPLLLGENYAAMFSENYKLLNHAGGLVGRTQSVETFQLLPASTVVDVGGNVIGRIDESGIPVAETGEPVALGQIVKNRAITKQGKVVGVLRPSDKSVVNEKGEVVGTLDPDGIAVSTSGAVLGKLSTGTVVVNSEGRLVGHLNTSAKLVSSDECYVGEIHGKCVVTAPGGDLVGTIDGQCVRNLKGEEIGIHLGQQAFDDKGDFIGHVLNDKLISLDKGGSVGRLSTSGELIDVTGHVIGRVKPDRALEDIFEFGPPMHTPLVRAVEVADKKLQVNFIDGNLVSHVDFETDYDMEGGGDPGMETLQKISKQAAQKIEELGEGVNEEICQLEEDMSRLSDRQLSFAKKLMAPSGKTTFRGMVNATIFAQRLGSLEDIQKRHMEELDHLQSLRNRILDQLSAKFISKSFMELRTYRRPPTAAALVVASVMMLLGDECCEKLKVDALEGKPFPSNPHYITNIWIQMRQHMTPQLFKRMQIIDTTVDNGKVVENCAAADFVVNQVPEDHANRVSQGVALLRHWVDLMLHIFKSSQIYREYLDHSEAP